MTILLFMVCKFSSSGCIYGSTGARDVINAVYFLNRGDHPFEMFHIRYFDGNVDCASFIRGSRFDIQDVGFDLRNRRGDLRQHARRSSVKMVSGTA